MITKLLTFLSLTILLFSFIDKGFLEKIWTEQTKVGKIIDYEKSISKNNEFIDMNSTLSESIYPLVNQYKISKPIIVKREQTGFLPVYAQYYYSVPDSIIRFVSYDWEKDKFDFLKKQQIWKDESQKLDNYNAEYDRIKKDIVAQLGQPNSQDNEPQVTKSASNRGDYYSRTTVWETDTYYGKLSMIFESMTYRIRMNYYWKK